MSVFAFLLNKTGSVLYTFSSLVYFVIWFTTKATLIIFVSCTNSVQIQSRSNKLQCSDLNSKLPSKQNSKIYWTKQCMRIRKI